MSRKAVGSPGNPPVQKGDGGFSDWVIVALHGLREYRDHPYRRLMDVLHETPRIVEELGLTVAKLPDFTPVCTRKRDLEMAVWRVLLRLSVALHDLGEVQAIDATGDERHSASQYYANRMVYLFEAVKTTILVNCETRVTLDVHWSMKLPHDAQIGWQDLTSNLDRLETVAADRGDDRDALRQESRDAGVPPVIKHREFWPFDAAHDARHDDAVYHPRSNTEASFFTLRHRFSETLPAGTWLGQFREVVLEAAVRNIELAVRSASP